MRKVFYFLLLVVKIRGKIKNEHIVVAHEMPQLWAIELHVKIQCMNDKNDVITAYALTPKQQMFCENIVAGMRNNAAYKAAFGTNATTTANNESQKLLNRHDIKQRIRELQEEDYRCTKVKLEAHLDRLAALGKKAEEMDMIGVAIQAELNRGKASGLYIERREVTGADGGPVNVNACIKVVFGDDNNDTDNSEISSEA